MVLPATLQALAQIEQRPRYHQQQKQFSQLLENAANGEGKEDTPREMKQTLGIFRKCRFSHLNMR